MVFVNTLLLQQVLAPPHWAGRLTDRDRKARTPLIEENVTLRPPGTRHAHPHRRARVTGNGGWCHDGWERAYLSDIERGIRNPSLLVLRDLAVVLGRHPAVLLVTEARAEAVEALLGGEWPAGS